MPEEYGSNYLSNQLFGGQSRAVNPSTYSGFSLNQTPAAGNYGNDFLSRQMLGGGALQQAPQGFGQQLTDGLTQGVNSIGQSIGSGYDSLSNYLGNQSLGDITGAVGTGLQAYSALFGPGADIGKQRLELLKQQVDNNREVRDNRRNFNKNFANASNALYGTGGGTANG